MTDTHETSKTTIEELDVEQGSKTTKHVGVELELQENSPSDLADIQENSKTTDQEPEYSIKSGKGIYSKTFSIIISNNYQIIFLNLFIKKCFYYLLLLLKD